MEAFPVDDNFRAGHALGLPGPGSALTDTDSIRQRVVWYETTDGAGTFGTGTAALVLGRPFAIEAPMPSGTRQGDGPAGGEWSSSARREHEPGVPWATDLIHATG